MATVTIYIPKENGDLKYVADVEEENDAALALDAVLDEMPRLKDTVFAALVSEEGNGVGHMLVLEVGDEPPARRPKRNIAVSNGVAPLSVNEDDSEPEAEPEEEAPAPKRTRKPAARRGTAAKHPARKPAAKKAAAPSGGRKLAKKPAARKRASGRKAPYTRSAKGDE